MSLFEKIIYLSDYAEKTREYDSCKRVRKFLFEDIHSLDYQGRLKRLDDACLMATDGIISAIKAAGRPLNERVYITRNSLLQKKIQI